MLALFVAAGASLATSQAPPGSHEEMTDRMTFTREDPVETRRLRVLIRAGAEDAHWAIYLSTFTPGAGVTRPGPVAITVTRADTDETVTPDESGPGYRDEGADWSWQLWTTPVCPAGRTCEETYTVTFVWSAADVRDAVAVDATINVHSDYPSVMPSGTAPPDAGLSVEYSP